ncbi:MAG TPA: alpha/beta hydrolase [Janthinobacterium sp.]|nr:alpha/beta hydrolase [Janthinobacterium sp.]
MSIAVPLDHDKPDGPFLTLHVTLAPAFRETAKADPLFLLAGGPGQAGSDILPLLESTFRRARATRDIVLIDQRGTGLSGKLDCDSKNDEAGTSDRQLAEEVRHCVARLKQPLAMYTTAAAARDIETVRRALGYGKINLWGGSYGSRLAQVYARLFPASVRSLILDGVAAPEQIIPAGGRDAQAALDALFKLCAADAACAKTYPGLKSEFAALTALVARGGVPVSLPDPRTAAPVQLTIDRTRFVATIHAVLYSAIDSRRLPYLIHSAYLGNWAPFLARSNLANDFSADGEVAYGLHLAVTCAEDAPRLTPQFLNEDAGASFLAAPLIRRVTALCDLIKVPAVPWRAPGMIEAPALLLSGALDPVTPPRRAVAAARYMPHAQQVVVQNAGHGISTLGCAPRLLREFLDRPERPVAAACLGEIAAPSFQLGNAGPQP